MFSVSGLTTIINQLLPEPHAGLLAGLLFGTKATLAKDFTQALIATGTIHIVALSGMNITIVSDLVARTLSPRVGKRKATLLTLVLIFWFVWFVGPSSTIVRAAIMGSISLISVLFGKEYIALLSWMLAVMVMLTFKFDWLFEISFQLSTLATLGIILFGSAKKGNIIKDDLHLTLSAQVFTIPLILFYFHRISLIAPLANLAIGFLIAPLTILGWIIVLTGYVFLPLAQMFAWVAWAVLQYLIFVVTFLSKIPGVSIGL